MTIPSIGTLKQILLRTGNMLGKESIHGYKVLVGMIRNPCYRQTDLLGHSSA